MSTTLERRLPTSNEKRKIAIDDAKAKNDSLPPGTQIITTPTKNRLNSMHTAYNTLIAGLENAHYESTQATSAKNKAQDAAHLWTSHYYQALNNAIARGDYPAEVRPLFHLDVISEAVPLMESEDMVKLWGERVSSGETAMIAAGHPAMPYPSEPDVKIKVDDYKAKLIVQSTKMDATDTAQEALDAQNSEADKVIKKVWDEVETRENKMEGALPGSRAAARIELFLFREMNNSISKKNLGCQRTVIFNPKARKESIIWRTYVFT